MPNFHFLIYMLLYPFLYGPITIFPYTIKYKSLKVLKAYMDGLSKGIIYILGSIIN